MIRLVVADDETLFRSGIAMIVEAQPGLEVVAEAADGREAVAAVREHRPEVVLMDVQMPVVDGIAATEEIVRQSLPTKVLVLTTFGVDETAYAALRAGASGFLLKTEAPSRLVSGIHAVAAGETLLAPTITRRLIEQWVRRPDPGDPDPRLARLTDREREVLTLVAGGLSNSELAARLHLGEATVKTHLGRVLAKTGCRDRVQAVVLAYESGLVVPGD